MQYNLSELDLHTILKASQALSSEIILDKILKNFLKIIIENSGAQRGFLLLKYSDELLVEGEININSGETIVRQSIPLNETKDIAVGVVNYANRTLKNVVLDDAAQKSIFSDEPYIKKHNIKSILCIPILRASKLVGILYLENNLTPGAFTPQRQEILKLLSAQAAISLENALLYNELYETYNELKKTEKELEKHRDHLEELVKERTLKLEQTLSALKRSNEGLEQFAYVASHDLREPLRTIISFTQLLSKRYKDKLDDEANEFIRFSVEGAQRMNELISDLLTYSRVGTQGISFKLTNCEELLGKVILNLQAFIQEKGAKIKYKNLPTVKGDRHQLIQLFQNLIGNAIKFHGEKSPRIHISAQKEENKWVFSVKDNGIGMDPKYFSRIFQIFQRLHTREEYSGSGIGLAICQKIVERHGGKIWVESEVGKGSTFYFTI